MRNILKLLFIAVLLMAGHNIRANVKIANVFSNHMVLQADRNITVWGTADRAEAVRIEINGISAATRAGLDGKWRVELSAMEYGGPHKLNVFGDDTLTLKDVMVGEVWLCGGQSNMRMTVRGVINAKEEISKATYRNIRFLTVPQSGATVPKYSFDVQWEVCLPATVSNKSASAYFFGRKLALELNVAIGLVDVSYGGARISTFMDEETARNTVDTARIHQNDRDLMNHFLKMVTEWENNGREGKRPSLNSQGISTFCYNAMVNPVIPFANRGAIWYQGESDAAHPETYVTWFGDYITMMREKFNNAEMPFYFVQLAGFENQHNTNVPPEIWAKFRLGQEQCLKYPNTGMVTAMDIGMKDNIHPKNKQEVGRRLALCALNETYGKTEVICQGPQLKSIEMKGKKLLLTFDHCEGDLKNRDQGKYIKGFSAILANGDAINLEGRIKSGNSIEIKAPAIERLRYAFANYPVSPLYNGAGLPALPFDEEIK